MPGFLNGLPCVKPTVRVRADQAARRTLLGSGHGGAEQREDRTALIRLLPRIGEKGGRSREEVGMMRTMAVLIAAVLEMSTAGAMAAADGRGIEIETAVG